MRIFKSKVNTSMYASGQRREKPYLDYIKYFDKIMSLVQQAIMDTKEEAKEKNQASRKVIINILSK